ncbi:conjugal transfer protein TraC [Streptomyces sp. NPDC050315]|uniref:VirB4 family type IV secretion system protein n=1 Tax=Streptomyces sp. NPDC050315 TaxID=3155039 RepID=UPI0034357BC6
MTPIIQRLRTTFDTSGLAPRLPSSERELAAPGGGTAGWGPESVQLRPRVIAVGDDLAATLLVTGYPADVVPGWLEPLLAYPGRLDVSLHIEPVPSAVAAGQLRKQRGRIESRRRMDHREGRLEDPETEAAAEDALELAHRIARGEGKLFRAGLYLTVHADTEDELAIALSEVRALAESMLLTCQPATWRSLQAWITSLPLGLDQLAAARTLDTEALAAAFPFASPDLPAQATTGAGTAVLYGLNTASAGVVMWDRWAQDNHNSITLARSGAGKSYLTKLDVLRSLYSGTEVYVIDPEDEYTRLADAVGGTVISVGAEGVHLNPLDLAASTAGEDAVTRQALFTHTFCNVLLGDLSPEEKAVLDQGILATYRTAGIASDARTHNRPAPLLADLADALRTLRGTGPMLADRLTPYISGSHGGLFNGPTTHRVGGHLTVFNLRHLPEELKAVGTLLTLDTIWRQVTDPTRRRRRLVVVDEAWLLMAQGAGARFLQRLAKSARKHWAGLAVVTQDAGDVLSTPLGQAVVANAATQILLRQAPQAIDAVSEAFHLSAGEREFLLAAPRGEGLLAAGRHRISFRSLASDTEHALITTGLDDAPGPVPAAPTT